MQSRDSTNASVKNISSKPYTESRFLAQSLAKLASPIKKTTAKIAAATAVIEGRLSFKN